MSARLQTWLIVVAALAIVAVGCGSSSAGDDGIATFPMAGTPTASPRTTVSFRGDSAGKITGIVVKGSKSSRHGGTLKPHPDGNGVSFVPKKDFRPGETVTVDAEQKLVREKGGVVKFKIAEKAPIGVPTEIRADPAGHPPGEQKFKSTNLRPLTLKINKRN